ncbi:MAG TPA: hypothetical protein PLQ63_08295 [Propionicimonas sp.]|nr:hypothetical protein [Propionicimonas sp.]
MPTTAVMAWGEAEVRVAPDGTSTRLLRDGELVVELAWTDATGAPAELEVADEVEHTLQVPGGKLLQRQSVADAWRSRWVLLPGSDVALTAKPPRVRVRPGPEYALWSWGSGVTALLAVSPAHAEGPVLGFRLEQGYLEEAGDPEWSSATADYLVAPRGSELTAGQRLVTALRANWFDRIDDLAAKLPPWLNDTQLDEDEEWWGDLADFGVSGPDDVQIEYAEGMVCIAGQAGRKALDVHTPRGLSRVPLEWVPSLQEVLDDLVRTSLGLQAPLTAAEAFCVQCAADRHLVRLDDEDQDLLDRVDWAADESPLGAAFALLRGRNLGEAALVSDALRVLSRLPVGVGYGRTVMAGWLASLSVGMDARERCLELLGRSAVGRTALLESSLLHYRNAEFGAAELAGVANRLGGMLPGEAPLLTWNEQAELVGLLELCPPEWPGAARYSNVADKARGQVLCGYVDNRIDDAEPLALLLLSPELRPGG